MAEQIITIQSNDLIAKISTLGAELKSVSDANSTEFIWNGDPAVWSGRCPILFPICGGLIHDKYSLNGKEYTLKKHGFAKLMEFSVKEKSENSVTMMLTATEETKKSFPFDFEFNVSFTVKDSTVSVEYKTVNLSKTDMYYSVGAHEGYACPEGIEEYSVVFDKKETLDAYQLDGNLLRHETDNVLKNDNKLDLDYRYFAIDALVFKHILSDKLTLVHQKSNKKITVAFPGFDYLLLWTVPQGKYICVEPWTGVPDSVDSTGDITKKEGITCLEAGKTNSVVHTITFEN